MAMMEELLGRAYGNWHWLAIMGVVVLLMLLVPKSHSTGMYTASTEEDNEAGEDDHHVPDP